MTEVITTDTSTPAVDVKAMSPVQRLSWELDSGDLGPKIAGALDGTGISKERFSKAAIAALTRPEADYLVKSCSFASITVALLNAAAAGIELHPALQHGYLIPRGGKAQLQVSYKGKIAMAMRHPSVAAIDVGIIRDGDEYQYETGTQPRLVVRPSLDDDGEWLAAYCITHYHGGVSVPVLMTRKQIEKHRDKYSDAWGAKNGSPGKGRGAAMWRDTPEEMAKKTVIHRASKQWPITIPGGDEGSVEVIEDSPAPVMRDITPNAHLDALTNSLTT